MMKKLPSIVAALALALSATASTTIPLKGQLVKPNDSHIQYVGRMVTTNPDSYRFS